MVTVLVADDDELVRDALSELLQAESGIELVGVAGDPQAAGRLAAEFKPNVALIDVRMAGGGGPAAAQEITRVSPETRLVALSALEDRGAVIEMLSHGVMGYQVKGAPSEEIVEAILRAARGQFSMPADLARSTFGGLVDDLADRRQVENARLLAETRVVNLFNSSISAAVLIDADGKVILANRRLLNLFGYDAEALVGTAIEGLLTPRSRRNQARLHPGAEDSKSGVLRVAGLICLRSDGSHFPADALVATIQTPSGHEAVVAFTDRSSGQAADGPTIDDELPRRMLDAAPDAMVVVNNTGEIELVNQQVERLFGYERTEMLGNKIEMLLPKRFAKVHIGHRSKFLADPQIRPMGFGLTLAGRRKDGSEFPVDISLSPVESAKGWLVVAAIRDITERRRVEEDLRKVDERFRQLVESSPDGMVIIDPEGRIQQVNAQSEALFGYDRQELVGFSIEMLLPERFRGVHVGHRTQYLARPQRRPMGAGLELAGRRKDGSEFSVDISLTPLETSEGTFGVAHVRDVTARKGAERDLLLAHLVRAQEEERLRIASDIHDDTIQAITAAGLRLQLLRRQLTDERQLETLVKLEDTVQLAIGRLRNLMFDLRPPALERDGLAAALRVYLDQLQADTGINTTLDARLPDEPPHDTRAIIYRVIQESLTNVRKHSGAVSVVVRVSAAEGRFKASVEDDGVGFTPAEAEPRPGHVGLVAMRERAEMAHGGFELISAPGKGTLVTFWVPNQPTFRQVPSGPT
jgi:PAS domain S-box-containing protein